MTDAQKQERSKKRSKIKDFKLNLLLEVTKSINNNQSAGNLLSLFESILKGPLGIGKLIMYVKEGQAGWVKKLGFGFDIEGFSEIDVEQHLTAIKEINLVEIKDDNNVDSFDIVVPVYHKETALAYILLGDQDEQQLSISPIIKHLPFIQTLANIILVAIENKRLAKENINRQILDKELEMASEMQHMLFPKTLPNNNHYEVNVIYKPHSKVGGDIYDYIEINEDESVFCLADVSGKGISAALLMANFIANLRALVTYNPSLEEVAHLLNKKVVENARGERFVTMFLAKYNNKTKVLEYINAAHQPPLLLKKNKVEQLSLGCTGMGMLDEIPKVEIGKVELQNSNILVTYTDGIIDTLNDAQEEFDQEKIEKLLLNHKTCSAAMINEKIIEQLDVHRAKNPYLDDIALLTVRFN